MQSLTIRRQKLLLKCLQSVYYNKNITNLYEYLSEPKYVSLLRDSSGKILEYTFKAHTFGSSFLLRTIQEWSRLPDDMVNKSNNVDINNIDINGITVFSRSVSIV